MGGGGEGLCLSEKVVLRAPWEPGQAGDASAKAKTGNLEPTTSPQLLQSQKEFKLPGLFRFPSSFPIPTSPAQCLPTQPCEDIVKVSTGCPASAHPSKSSCKLRSEVLPNPRAWMSTPSQHGVAGTTFTLSPETTKENHTDEIHKMTVSSTLAWGGGKSRHPWNMGNIQREHSLLTRNNSVTSSQCTKMRPQSVGGALRAVSPSGGGTSSRLNIAPDPANEA